MKLVNILDLKSSGGNRLAGSSPASATKQACNSVVRVGILYISGRWFESSQAYQLWRTRSACIVTNA